MNLTPEQIDAAGKALIGMIAAVGAIVATVASAVAAFYTWKNRYELDKLYAAKFRPNEDGTPGPMRQHPAFMVKAFERTLRPDQLPDPTNAVPNSPVPEEPTVP